MAVEEKVDNNEAAFKAALIESEARMMACVQDTVKDMVLDQLKAAGFDPDLTAGALSSRCVTDVTDRTPVTTYATAAKQPAVLLSRTADVQQERREERFWQCRRSLRLWPVEGGDSAGLKAFLKEKLRVDANVIDNDLGEVLIRKHKDLKAKTKNEVIVEFDSKETRDMIKSHASNLANYRDEAGMRLHLPNHLQKDFKALMGLSYDLKQKNAGLKRNVKFDEDDLGLFMDVQFKKDGQWKRIKPDQARRALESSGTRRGGPDRMQADEIADMLAGGGDESDE